MKNISKTVFFCLTLLFIVSCSGNKQASTAEEGFSAGDFLKVSGKVVKDNAGNGRTIHLKGTNLGGWLMREGWMDPIGHYMNNAENEFTDDYTSRMVMIERFGEEETDKLLDEYQNIYIQESDLDTIKALGLNFVRVPIYWMEILNTEGKLKSGAFDQIDWVIEQCNKRKMYVILDLHGSPGGHSDGYLTGGQKGSNELWTNKTYQEWTIQIWKEFANRYKGNPTVAAYDLLNEPVASKDSQLSIVDMYDILYRTIREIDKDHIIMMGAFYTFAHLCDPKEKNWENVIYQTHHYDDSNRTNWDSQNGFIDGTLAYLKEYRDKWNIPVYPGEYNFWQFTDLWAKWMQELNKENIMWSNWTYKNTDTSQTNNWGFYINNTNELPDLSKDSPETIILKWQKFSSDHYQLNEALKKVVSANTK